MTSKWYQILTSNWYQNYVKILMPSYFDEEYTFILSFIKLFQYLKIRFYTQISRSKFLRKIDVKILTSIWYQILTSIWCQNFDASYLVDEFNFILSFIHLFEYFKIIFYTYISRSKFLRKIDVNLISNIDINLMSDFDIILIYFYPTFHLLLNQKYIP